MIRVNSPNSGCLPNIGNGPQSGPPLYIKAKGRKAAHIFIMGPKGHKIFHQLVMRPKAAKWLIIVSRGLNPVFGTLPVFSEFTLHDHGIVEPRFTCLLLDKVANEA